MSYNVLVNYMIKFYYRPNLRRPPPIRAKKFIFKTTKQRIIFRVVCALLIFCIVWFLGDSQLRPIIKNAGANALKNELTLMLNQAVTETVQNENTIYGDFVTINYSETGEISTIVSNTVYINEFKAELSKSMSQTLEKFGDFYVLVPWGTLLGSELFSDRGMELKVESSTYGFTVTDVCSTFESVGINQTLHKIFIEAELTATAYIGNYKFEETIVGKVPVAETVIVGKVPNAYYEAKK